MQNHQQEVAKVVYNVTKWSHLMTKPTKLHVRHRIFRSGHLPSLPRVYAVRIKKAGVVCYPLSAQRRFFFLFLFLFCFHYENTPIQIY